MRSRGFDINAFAYAHRGLWGEGVPENSIAAFRAARDAGLGVELDVRPAQLNQIMVFHDATLDRMCGDPRRVVDVPGAEIWPTIKLPNGESIPPLSRAISAMADMPILIELKIDAPDGGAFAERVAAEVRKWNAKLACMSFDEPTVARLRELLPDHLVGLLIEPLDRLGKDGVAAKVDYAQSIGCDYLGPHISALNTVSRLAPDLPRTVWTVRNLGDLAAVRAEYAAPIFEGFSPELAKGFANLPNG